MVFGVPPRATRSCKNLISHGSMFFFLKETNWLETYCGLAIAKHRFLVFLKAPCFQPGVLEQNFGKKKCSTSFALGGLCVDPWVWLLCSPLWPHLLWLQTKNEATALHGSWKTSETKQTWKITWRLCRKLETLQKE